MPPLSHRVVWVGRRASCPFLSAADDYAGRLNRYAKAEVILVRGGDSATVTRGMRRAAAQSRLRVALDERGKQLSTEEMVAFFQAHAHLSSFCYFIGDADGLPPALAAEAEVRWSLSRLTLPHRAALAILLEQLFRAHTMMAGERYHRA